jgi:hypothetical protein
MLMLNTATYGLTMDVFGPKLIMPIEMNQQLENLEIP